jgi:ceramide glucosyltransferase
VIFHGILMTLALLSLALTVWQWLAARRFPLHQRSADLQIRTMSPISLLKPLKGCDEHTEVCLRSWLAQDYPGEVQVLFAVGSADDPACAVVKKLLAEFPQLDAQLLVCPERLGANAKVSALVQLEPRVKHDIIIISDADVRVPADLLSNAIAPLGDEKVGLVSCFYRLANPTTLAMRWEAIAVNADFWSQVLQSASFRKLDFALGAVMATRRQHLAEIGGFRALVDCLADDYQLGHRIARRGYRIELCPVVVDCWSEPMGWRKVWRHQLRWARTIRACQPVPYFFSIMANATLWPLLWAIASLPHATVETHQLGQTLWTQEMSIPLALIAASAILAARILAAFDLQQRLTLSTGHARDFWLVPLKDLLQAVLWLCAFAGNHIEWRGEHYGLRRDGTLEKIEQTRVS